MLDIDIIFDHGSLQSLIGFRMSFNKLQEDRYFELKYFIKTSTEFISSISLISCVFEMLFLMRERILRSGVDSGIFCVREEIFSIQARKFDGPRNFICIFSLLTRVFKSSFNIFSFSFSSLSSSCLLLINPVIHLLRLFDTS